MGLDSKKDVHLAGSSVGPVSRLEVLEGPSGRRVRSEAERSRIVETALVGCALFCLQHQRRASVVSSSSSCPPSIKRNSPFRLSTWSQNRGPFHVGADMVRKACGEAATF